MLRIVCLERIHFEKLIHLKESVHMAAQPELKKENTNLQKPDVAETPQRPAIVAAEEMFGKLVDLSRDIAERAYAFFRERGGEFGKELDDWFKAENEILRPVTVEIRETKDKIIVTAAVPGFKANEIEVSVKDNILVINGETEATSEKEDGQTVFSEWKSNRFFRQLMLPATVESENVSAKLSNGMLNLTMTKAPAPESHKIPVTAE
jgi:HSP20 family protein